MSTVKPGAAKAKQRSRWFSLVWIIPAALVLFALLVLLAQWLRGLPEVQSFLTDYPGESELPEGAPVGFPAWFTRQASRACWTIFHISAGLGGKYWGTRAG